MTMITKNKNCPKDGFDLFLFSRYRNELYGAAILWILLFHARLCDYEWPKALRIFKVGFGGVEIFLLLSGISLFFSWSSTRSIRVFYAKRLIRILVPFLMILLPYYLFFFSSMKMGISWQLPRLLWNLSTLNFWIRGSQQTWYVSMILAAYLVYPLLYLIIFRGATLRSQIIRTLVLCLLEILWVLFLYLVLPGYAEITEIAWTRFPIFTWGCFSGRPVKDHVRLPASAVSFCMLVLLILIGFLYYFNSISMNLLRLWAGLCAVPLSLVLTCFFSWTEKSGLKYINRFFRFLGSITLELYLIHIALITTYTRDLWIPYKKGNLWMYTAVILVSILLSFLFSRINQRIIAWVSRKLLISG